MKGYAVGIMVLTGTFVSSLCDESSSKSRPAWTSTLQCLAPLARQARDGVEPLTIEQAFFDGPFSHPPQSTNYNEAGFAQLFSFDDREAERNFRYSLYKDPGDPIPWIGLAFANRNSERRSSFFLNEAQKRQASASPEFQDLLESLPDLFAGDIQQTLQSIAGKYENPILQGLVTREQVFATLKQDLESDTTFSAGYSNPFPLPYRMPIPILLSEDNGSNRTTAPLIEAIEADLDRLDRIASVMPDASVNMGSSASLLLRRLSLAGHHERVAILANQLLSFPRDPFSVGNRWGNLTRENSLWPAVRREYAGSIITQEKWNLLTELPRGFDAQDKAEWYAWQALAAIETDGDFNPWLAAIRAIRGTDDLVSKLETYLETREQGESILPSIPGVYVHEKEPSPSSLDSSPIPSFTPAVRPEKSFSLPDWEKNTISLSDYKGQPVIVIFFLGGGCLHCVEQLTAFGPWAEKFRTAGIEIVSISTDPVDVLTQTLSDDEERTKSFPIPIASDSENTVFREWKVFDEFDGRPLHGTFLVDAAGNIIWEEKGNTPYMHPDFLLYEAQRLLAR